MFGDSPKNATIENFNDKPYEKNDDLASEMKTVMDKDKLVKLFSTIRNEKLNYSFIVGSDDRVYGVATLDNSDPANPKAVQIKDFSKVAKAIKEDFEQGADSALRNKKQLQNYKDADKYLSNLVLVNQYEEDGKQKEETAQLYSNLQALLPKNMSVTDWLRTAYGLAVYDQTSNIIVRRNEDKDGNVQPGIASVTNYNNGTGVKTNIGDIWDALLTDTAGENGRTVSLIRKVAHNRDEAKQIIDDTAKKTGDEAKAKSELEKKVRAKKGPTTDVDDWLNEEYQGGDAQQDGKTWNGEDSGKGSDNYMWIWLLGIGLCLAAEYAVWKKRKEN